MKKNQIIGLIIILAVAIPGIGLGIYFGLNMATDNIIEDAEVSVDSVEVESADETSITVSLSGEVKNPSTISATIDPMDLSVGYDGIEFGITQTTSINAQAGNSSFNQNCVVSIADFDQFNLFLTSFVKNSSVSLDISGTANISAGGFSITKNISKSIVLDGLNDELDISLSDFAIINATETEFYANLSVNVNNPSSVQLRLKNAEFELEWQEWALGILTIPEHVIEQGNNSQNLIASINIVNSSVFGNVTEQLLNQEDVTINVYGRESGDNILDGVFKTLSFDVIIAGISNAECIILDVDIVDSSANSISFEIDMEIFNPTMGSVDIENLQFNTTYNDEEVGIIDFPDITVQTGTHLYTTIIDLELTDLDLLSDLLTEYLNGTEITLKLEGISTGGNIIMDILDGFVQYVDLPPVPEFTYEIRDIELSDATSDTLILNATLAVENPVSFNVTLDELILDVKYTGSWIGNLTLGETNLTSGENLVYTQITLSGEEDKAAVEEFLSNHISGINTDLNLDGNISFRLTGMSDPINITVSQTKTLNGITDDLIKSIQLNSLAINIALFTMTANMDATISNPFNFAINITYLDYEVYFDDSDGVTVPYYAPDYDIFITHINRDYSSSPIEMNAESEQILHEPISPTNHELLYRLNDEYFIDDDLLIDIKNGIMHVAIGEFTIEIEFSFSDIPV